MIPHNLTIINYHKIEHNSDIGLTTRHPADFANDLKIIRDSGFSTITFNDLNNHLSLPQKPLIITFDDAYLSFYDKALDTLNSNNMKAVVFVPVNYIGKKNYWDVQFFKKEYWHMDKTQIMDSSKEGMEIGSHGLSHQFLNHMSNENIKHEFKKSKQTLEDITGNAIISVSYPFGRANLKVLEQAKENYKYGVQLLQSTEWKQFPNLSLRRINIYRTDNSKTFKRKLDYNNYPLTKIKSYLIQSGAWATVFMQKINRHDKKVWDPND